MKTTHYLTRGLIIEIHLEITMLSLSIDDALVGGCYFLVGSI